MGKYRLYCDKNASILEDYPLVNTGVNEVAELWYGESGISRFLLRFDVTSYMNLFTEGLVPAISAATVTLKLKDVTPIFEELSPGDLENARASSFDLAVYLQEEEWDEGNGKDFVGLNKEDGFCCWYSATSTSGWTTSGGSTNILIGSQHFDKGNEDAEIVLDSTVAAMWSLFTGTNYGLMIAFSASQESQTTALKTIKKFYTRHTHTIYEPALDIEWNSVIQDNRNDIWSGSSGNVVLYTYNNGVLSNVSAVTSCFIVANNATVSSYTSSDIVHPQDGVYLVPFRNVWSAGTVLSDTWVVKPNSEIITAVTLSFTSATIPWSYTSVASVAPTIYDFVVPNIKPVYSQGERPTLIVRARKYYQTGFTILRNIEYRLDLKDSNLNIEMIPWTKVNYSIAENFVNVDTQWLPKNQTYELRFRYNDSGAVIYDAPVKTFKVI